MRAMPPMKIDWWVEKREEVFSLWRQFWQSSSSRPQIEPPPPLPIFSKGNTLGGQLLFSLLLPSWVASPSGAPIYELSKKRAKEEGEIGPSNPLPRHR